MEAGLFFKPGHTAETERFEGIMVLHVHWLMPDTGKREVLRCKCSTR